MKVSGPYKSQSFQMSRSDGELLNEQIVAVGTRCRLKAVILQDISRDKDTLTGASNLEDTDIKLHNGDSSDDTVFEVVSSLIDMTLGATNLMAGIISDNIQFHGAGILCDNGLNLSVDFTPSVGDDARDEAKLLITVMYQ